MEVRVLWTDSALSQLEDIYDYKKILEANPLIGGKESLLSERPFEYRFLIKNNYKIIYRFNENLIRIISVFDCRQNPKKIVNITE